VTIQLTSRPRLLTVAEYLELGETESGYSELVEGRAVLTPSTSADHNWAVAEARDKLRPQLPPGMEIIIDIDVDLELAPPDEPGFCRRPDLVIVAQAARLRQRREGGVIRASEVVIVMEFVSPGSRRTDQVTKRGEYADAGIPNYWIVDLAEPISLLACHHAGEFGYADDGGTTNTFSTTTPFPVQFDLDGLR
jgi:Uma2 family endonuclease